MKSFLLLCDVFSFIFWKRLKTPKKLWKLPDLQNTVEISKVSYRILIKSPIREEIDFEITIFELQTNCSVRQFGQCVTHPQKIIQVLGFLNCVVFLIKKPESAETHQQKRKYCDTFSCFSSQNSAQIFEEFVVQNVQVSGRKTVTL